MPYLHLSNRLAPSAPPPPATRPRLDRAQLDAQFAERVEKKLQAALGLPSTLTAQPSPETVNLASIATGAKQHLAALKAARGAVRRATTETIRIERNEGRGVLASARKFYDSALKFAESSPDGAEICDELSKIYGLVSALSSDLEQSSFA